MRRHRIFLGSLSQLIMSKIMTSKFFVFVVVALLVTSCQHPLSRGGVTTGTDSRRIVDSRNATRLQKATPLPVSSRWESETESDHPCVPLDEWVLTTAYPDSIISISDEFDKKSRAD